MTEVGLRERKKRAVRQRILDTCDRLFRSYGFDDTTIDMILEEVAISRQTFFNHFPGKDAVLAKLGLSWLRAQAEVPRSHPEHEVDVRVPLRLGATPGECSRLSEGGARVA